MAAKLRDYLNLPGYVYPVSLSRQSSLESAVDYFFLLLLLPRSYFKYGKTQVITQTTEKILLKKCQMLVCF